MRELGKPAVTGCRGLTYDKAKQELTNANSSVRLRKGGV